MILKLSLHPVEQEAAIRHLRLRRACLFSTDVDKETIDAILARLDVATSIAISHAERCTLIRHLRARRMTLMDEMHSLEARRRVVDDPALHRPWHALDVDGVKLDEIIRRLWTLAI